MLTWAEFERQQPAPALGVEGCLLMLTEAGDTFPRAPTIWRAR